MSNHNDQFSGFEAAIRRGQALALAFGLFAALGIVATMYGVLILPAWEAKIAAVESQRDDALARESHLVEENAQMMLESRYARDACAAVATIAASEGDTLLACGPVPYVLFAVRVGSECYEAILGDEGIAQSRQIACPE